VKPKKGQADAAAPDEAAALRQAVVETLKYAVKPEDMAADPQWFFELTRQTHKLRFVASGGSLKDVLKGFGEESDEDLTMADGEGGEAESDERFLYAWRAPHYRHVR
jgi:hypothetical protein